MLEGDGGIFSFSEAEKDEMYAFLKKLEKNLSNGENNSI